MNKLATIVIIVTLAAGIIFSSSLSDVFAKGKVTKGPLKCVDALTGSTPTPGVGEYVQCCRTETGSGGIEIRYCTNCNNTSPPSNCGPRYEEQPGSVNPNDPKENDLVEQLSVTPSKSNEKPTQRNDPNLGQQLTPSKSNEDNSN